MPEGQELLKQLSDQKYALDQAAIVAATDARGVITYVNRKFCEVSGYDSSELVGRTHKVINSGFHPPEFFKQLWETISKGDVWRAEVCNRRKNGTHYWVYTTIVPFLDKSGEPNQYLSIRYEITDLKKAQQLILDQQEKLIASSRLSAIGELAAAVTHEINNPLAVILGRVEMLKAALSKKEIDREQVVRMLESIEITGHRIEKIVRSMKAMAHHQEEEDAQNNDVAELIDDAMTLCAHRVQKLGVTFERPEFDSALIRCRSHQIVQVLVNLINNALDAIASQEIKWVRLEVRNRPDYVDLVISDSGRGISPEIQNRMFQPFFSTKSVQYGTGLGLSISQSLIERNGGFLRYDESYPNTTFILSLPKFLKA